MNFRVGPSLRPEHVNRAETARATKANWPGKNEQFRYDYYLINQRHNLTNAILRRFPYLQVIHIIDYVTCI